jgi:hypothetical protein
VTRRTITLGITACTLLAATLITGAASGDIDLAGLNTRIGTVETQTAQNTADIKQLQQGTGIAPASTPTTEPTSDPQPFQSTPAPSATPTLTPAPVSVVSGTLRVVDLADGGHDYYCDDVMSDGSNQSVWVGRDSAGVTLGARCSI